MPQPDEFDKLLEACRELRAVAVTQEKRLQRMEKVQMALLKAAGAFLRSLEEQEQDGSMGNGSN